MSLLSIPSHRIDSIVVTITFLRLAPAIVMLARSVLRADAANRSVRSSPTLMRVHRVGLVHLV